jgi:glycosyltransferase involved in cell wall biosynthesis
MIWIKQGRGHRTVLTIHSTEYGRCGNALADGQSTRVRDQERAGTYWANGIIAVSQATKDELAWLYDVPHEKITVIHNGVKPERFEMTTDPGVDKHRYHIAPLDPTVLFCGRLTQQKGPDLLVEAIPRILGTHPHAKFIFAGDGDMRASLEARVQQLQVAPSVRFLGHQSNEDLVRLFKLTDVVCVPSRNEPFGIVVLEAWSAGKPVIVTQTGGPNEYVTHEVNGLKIYAHPDSVTWGVNTLFSNFERARTMGHNGRNTVKERFGWKRIAEQTRDLYQWIRPADAADSQTLPRTSSTRIRTGRKTDPAIPVKLGARLSFRMAHSGNGDAARLAAFRESLTQQGFVPQGKGTHLSIDGDWETVLGALMQCHRQAYNPTTGHRDRWTPL